MTLSQRIGALALMVALLIAVAQWIDAAARLPAAIPDAQPIQRVDCVFQRNPPDASTTWQKCALPDDWDRTRPDYSGHAWYRFPLPPGHDARLALLLTNVSMNAELLINGKVVADGGTMEPPVARHWNEPMLFTIPVSSHSEAHTATIHLYGYANSSSGLGTIWLGSYQTLHRIHVHTATITQLFSRGAAVSVLLVGLFSLLLWFMQRDEREFLYFGLGALSSTFYIADTFLVYIPIDRNSWEWLSHGSILVSQVCFILFLLHLLRIITPIRQWILWGIAAVALIDLRMAGDDIVARAAPWEGLTVAFSVIILIHLYWLWVRHKDRQALFLSGCITMLLTFYLHDWIPWILGRGVTPPFQFYLGPTTFVVAVSGMIIARILRLRQQEQRFADELRQALAKQRMKLEESHKKMAKLLRRQAIREEQERITRELHDGVGGFIIAARGLIQRQRFLEAENQLDMAIAELRMVMDSLDAYTDALTMLAMMRNRIEKRLRAMGVELRWLVQATPKTLSPNPTTAIHLLRIVQESINNAINHGRPQLITIISDEEHVVIIDDGKGFDPSHCRRGRGLTNMQWRAQQIGAELTIASGSQGTRISLTWN